MRIEMPEKRKKYDREFREGAVRIVDETKKPIAQVARDLGVNEGTLGNWVNRAREAAEGTRGLSKDDVEELRRLRTENAELRMERDVLKRSVVLWVKEATRCAWPASSPRSRLLVCERYGCTRWWAPALVEPVAVVSFVMTQRMLRGSGIGQSAKP
jgi:transposase